MKDYFFTLIIQNMTTYIYFYDKIYMDVISMKFDVNISKDDYIKFWKENSNQHFLNSYWWGIVSKNNKGVEPLYVGLRDKDNNILCETLLLKKKTPLNMCYYYAPRGYVIDWNNKKLVDEFTNAIKKYMKDTNAIYLRIDPAIMYQEIDMEANPIKDGKNNYELFNYLKELGYKHKGFYKLYEGNQPRYTFRTINSKYNSFDEIEKSISKSTMRDIKRSYKYNLKIEISDNIDNFYKLHQRVAKKDDFHVNSESFFKDIYNTFKEGNYAKNFIAKINLKEVIKSLEEEKASIFNDERIKRIDKDIEFFKSKLTDEDEILIASMLCVYSENGAWALYIGTDEIAEYINIIQRFCLEFMKDSYDSGKEFSDLFGTVGDPHTKYKNLAGIFEYKRKLGGDYIEWMGDFDLVNKPFWYKVLPILLKIYRKIKK